jgi:hypothetical protein
MIESGALFAGDFHGQERMGRRNAGLRSMPHGICARGRIMFNLMTWIDDDLD